MSNREIQERKVASEIRLDPFFNPQLRQPGTLSLQPRKLQAQPICRIDRVVSTCGLMRV